jgi:hypothetical protein
VAAWDVFDLYGTMVLGGHYCSIKDVRFRPAGGDTPFWARDRVTRTLIRGFVGGQLREQCPVTKHRLYASRRVLIRHTRPVSERERGRSRSNTCVKVLRAVSIRRRMAPTQRRTGSGQGGRFRVSRRGAHTRRRYAPPAPGPSPDYGRRHRPIRRDRSRP